MIRRIIKDGKATELYYHKTNGGAEYLTDKYIMCPNGEKEGIFEDANIVIRIDGEELEFMPHCDTLNF